MAEKTSTSATVTEYNICIPKEDPVMEAIDCLQQKLNTLYLAGEKIMALRNPNLDSLQSISQSIDLTHDELLSKINQLNDNTAQLRSDPIVRNKIEFDSYIAALFEKCASDLMQTQSSSKSLSNVSTTHSCKASIRSKASSGSKIKLLEAEAEFKAAQVLAQQANERAEEELKFQQLLANQTQYKMMMSKREAQRKLEVAAAKLKVWQQSANRHNAADEDSTNSAVNHPSTNVLPMKTGTDMIPAMNELNNAVQTHTTASCELMNSTTTSAMKMRRCSAKSNSATTVSEFKSNLNNANAPVRVNRSRVSFAVCQPNAFMSSTINNTNYVCAPNAIYSIAPNATSTYTRQGCQSALLITFPKMKMQIFLG